jgi:hypothetical protein
MTDDLTPAEAHAVQVIDRLPDDVQLQLLAWIDKQTA